MYIQHFKNKHNKKRLVTSDIGVQCDNLIDFYTIQKSQENSTKLKKSTANYLQQNMQTGKVGDWLSLAAEPYQISSKLEDYICVPVIIMPSDLPNRNCVAFPYKDLTSFNPSPYVKQVSFRTWEGAPTFYEHQNDDCTKAKGVVFGVTMTKIPNSIGNLYKVIALCGFDRTKDQTLYTRIQNKQLSTYSMGALVDDYVCNICGVTFDQGGCNHVDLNNPRFQTFDTKDGPKLAYYDTKGMCGFEVSAVETPAYISAQNDYFLQG